MRHTGWRWFGLCPCDTCNRVMEVLDVVVNVTVIVVIAVAVLRGL
jgi:hypothetical protein